MRLYPNGLSELDQYFRWPWGKRDSLKRVMSREIRASRCLFISIYNQKIIPAGPLFVNLRQTWRHRPVHQREASHRDRTRAVWDQSRAVAPLLSGRRLTVQRA